MVSKTKRAYLDRRFYLYLFEIKSEAEGFITSLGEGMEIKDLAYYKNEDFDKFYRHGAEGINLILKNHKTVDIPLTKEVLTKRKYDSHEAQKNLVRLIETNEDQYLKGLKMTYFIVPASVEPKIKGLFPKLSYSNCELRTRNKNYGTVFTTESDFDDWNKTQNNAWQPLRIMFKELHSLFEDKDGVIINPGRETLILKQMLLQPA